jgi:WD40-like Beta Propeller Repeat
MVVERRPRRRLGGRLARAPLAAMVAVLWLIALSSPATGDVFGPIELVSADSRQQADFVNHSVISGDGRYVAFDGSFAGVTGVFRRDLDTGVVELVAPGDAELPSISAGGRYVSFTTTARLDEENDANAAPDVYVRDMENPDARPCRSGRDEELEPCAFTLVSAVDGSRAGLSYSYAAPATEEARYGSLATGRSALSADGSRVAFITTAVSNLANPGRPALPREAEAPETPALQVALRDLRTDRTELVSVLSEGGRVAESPLGQTLPVPATTFGGQTYGAAFPGGTRRPTFTSPYAGASLSADGTTVAWMGQQIERQAPVLGAEPSIGPGYAEPLWRRVADGPFAPTRRVTGGGDPASEACINSGEARPAEPPTLSDPCQGPFDTTRPEGSNGGVFTLPSDDADFVPQLSADGFTVAFVANAPVVGAGEFGRTFEFSDDLFLGDMHAGLTRVQALRRLTQVAGGNFFETERVAPVVDLGIAPDGSEIAFSTQRTVFPMGSPTYVSAPSAVAHAQELFDVDLSNDTLTRVTQSYQGAASEPTGAATGSPTLSGDGNTLAFTSAADDLVYGDGNGAGDAFTVVRKRFAGEAVQQYISPAPANPELHPAWTLSVTARSRKDGSVLLEVLVPGAGTLTAGAHSTLVSRRCTSGRKRACRRGGRGRRATTRTVASRSARPSSAELTLLTLKLAPRYGSLSRRRGGLQARVNLSFVASGHPRLRRRIAVTFRRARKARPRRGARR